MYQFKIYREVYEEMVSGRKKIEIRLLTEKTENIRIGDTIRFNVLDENLYIDVEVTNKHIYEDIDALWKDKEACLNSSIYSNKQEFTILLNQIFGEDKVQNSKIVGIEFKIK